MERASVRASASTDARTPNERIVLAAHEPLARTSPEVSPEATALPALTGLASSTGCLGGLPSLFLPARLGLSPLDCPLLFRFSPLELSLLRCRALLFEPSLRFLAHFGQSLLRCRALLFEPALLGESRQLGFALSLSLGLGRFPLRGKEEDLGSAFEERGASFGGVPSRRHSIEVVANPVACAFVGSRTASWRVGAIERDVVANRCESRLCSVDEVDGGSAVKAFGITSGVRTHFVASS